MYTTTLQCVAVILICFFYHVHGESSTWTILDAGSGSNLCSNYECSINKRQQILITATWVFSGSSSAPNLLVVDVGHVLFKSTANSWNICPNGSQFNLFQQQTCTSYVLGGGRHNFRVPVFAAPNNAMSGLVYLTAQYSNGAKYSTQWPAMTVTVK